MKNSIRLAKTFINPLIILVGILIYLVLAFFHISIPAILIIFSVTVLGSFDLFKDSFENLLKKHFALDYIAMLAIIVALATNEYLVAALIALMISSGRTLEEYGVSQAKKNLTKLADRIPNEITLWENDKISKKISINKAEIGQQILVRKGEVIGLDGILISQAGLTDESSLTGEPYLIDKIKGDQIRSGTINIGDPIVIEILKTQEGSTYNKIIEMVKRAQDEKAPLVRLADKYSTVFTIITIIIASFAYLHSHSLIGILAVLVIATPCPLILATPIALLGGVNASAKKRIIVKKLASIETLSKTTVFIFDKTGTITLGKPKIALFQNFSKKQDEEILSIAQSIERNSLHPVAKAIVEFSKQHNSKHIIATGITERVGSGISAVVNGKTYSMEKAKEIDGMKVQLLENGKRIAAFEFEDEIKEDSKNIIKKIRHLGISMFIYTGDKKAAAEKVVEKLGEEISIQAECTPEDKQKGIELLKKQGKITAMVGDGINDAPALALADVGIVFSNEEQTAASEAADIVLLGNDFSLILDSFSIARKTISIAMQSILFGIGASVIGMVFASFGLIPPVAGAFLQEAIDVAVILNALRAAR